MPDQLKSILLVGHEGSQIKVMRQSFRPGAGPAGWGFVRVVGKVRRLFSESTPDLLTSIIKLPDSQRWRTVAGGSN